MIDPQKARDIALWSGLEDYTGLYELIWDFNVQFPDASESEKLVAGQATITRLLEEELVVLYATRWLSADYHEIPSDDCASILAETRSWLVPSGDEKYHVFAVTDAGERAALLIPAGGTRS